MRTGKGRKTGEGKHVTKKSPWLVIIAVWLILGCNSEPGPQSKVFIKYYGKTGVDVASAAEPTKDGGFVLIGSTGSRDTLANVERQMYVMKADAYGIKSAENIFGDISNSDGRALMQTDDGGFVFLGDFMEADKTTDIYLVKTDGNLIKQWELTINIPNSNERGFALTALPSGNYFVLGTVLTSDGTTEMITAMITPDGKLYKSPAKPGLQYRNDNVGKTVALRSNGRVAWCGTQFRDHTGTDPGTSNIRIILSTEDGVSDGGDFDYGRQKNDVAADIQKVHSGFTIVGTSEGLSGEGSKIILLNTNEQGGLQWMKVLDKTPLAKEGNQTAGSVYPTRDGGYIIVGTTDQSLYQNQEGQNIYLIKTNGVGETEWEEIYGGRGRDEAGMVRETADGGFLITGTIDFNGDLTMCLIKTNSRGKLIN